MLRCRGLSLESFFQRISYRSSDGEGKQLVLCAFMELSEWEEENRKLSTNSVQSPGSRALSTNFCFQQIHLNFLFIFLS